MTPILAAVILAAMMGGCGGRLGSVPEDSSTNSRPTAAGSQPATSSDTLTSDETLTSSELETEPVASPKGEIWQWALGRNILTDPALRPYNALLDGSNSDVMDHADGVELTMDARGNVAAVTLFNDETALGYPPSSTSFSAYGGLLPGNLTWSRTATDLGVQYGADNQAGGYGTAITFSYVTTDRELDLTMAFMAGHEADLPGSALHWIKVMKHSG